MEAVIGTLISIDEQLKKPLDSLPKQLVDVLVQTTEVLARAHRGHLESVYNSIQQFPPGQYVLLWSSLLYGYGFLPPFLLSC